MGWPGPDVGVPPTFSKAQELVALKQQAESLEQSLGDLKASIQEIEQSRQDAKKK
jgi:prefoldin subunit 5